jgi:hypothetical protein
VGGGGSFYTLTENMWVSLCTSEGVGVSWLMVGESLGGESGGDVCVCVCVCACGEGKTDVGVKDALLFV